MNSNKPNPKTVDDPPELPSDSEMVGAAVASAGAREKGAGPANVRNMESAPLELRKAGMVLFVAALFPWLGSGGINLDTIWAKLVVVVGAVIGYYGVLNKHGQSVPGVFRAVGGANPKLLGWLSTLVMVIGVTLPAILIGTNQGGLSACVEVAGVAVGATLWIQILDYSMGAKFNPVMGLIVPLISIAAIGRLIFLTKKFDILALIGSVGVLAAGFMATRTMVAAMKEAKAHGEAKKRQAVEQRMQDRAAKKRTS